MAEEKKKLSYDELKAYADQTVAQAQKIYKENQKLIEEIKNLRMQMNYAEINLAFKALEFKNNFSPAFISKVARRLEEVLTPADDADEIAEKAKQEVEEEAKE